MSNNLIGRKVAKEAFVSFGGMGIGSVFRYLFSILLARWIGPQMLGIYSLGNAITRIGEIFGLMGLDNGVLRYVSREKDNNDNVKNTIYSSIKMGFLSSTTVALLLYFFSDWIALGILNEDKFLSTVIKVYALSLPFAITGLIASFATQGFKILKYKIFVNHIINPANQLIFMIISYLFFGVKIAILIPTVISAIFGSICIFFFLRKFITVSFGAIINAKIDYKILKFSFPLMFVSAIGIIMNWIDMLMLGILDNAYSVGLYHPIERTAGLIRLIFFAFASIFAPLFSEYFYEKNKEKMLEVYQLSTKWILLTSFPLFIFLILFSNEMLMLFGNEFNNNFALQILTTGVMIQALFGLGSSSLTMSGLQKYNLINGFFALLTNIILNTILIPEFGVTGAAIGTTVSLFLISILRFSENYYFLKLNFFSKKLIKPLFSGILTIVIVYFLKPYIFDSSCFNYLASALNLVIYLFLGMGVTLVIYLVLIFIFRLDEEDYDILKMIRNRFLNQ